jgi:hypothetical protein
MKVNIEYHDTEAYTVEEIVKNAQTNYGKSVSVVVSPDSPAPHDLIHFALQQIITHSQLSLLFDKKFSYEKDIKFLRAETLLKLEELLDNVIIENESKVA